MGEEQAQRSLAESWSFVRDQRKRMEAEVGQLSALELAEFRRATEHILEVAQELHGIAKHGQLARLEDETKRFAWAVGRAGEATEQLQRALARAGFIAPPSTELLPGAAGAMAREAMVARSGAQAVLGQLDGAGNGRAVKQRVK